MREDETSLFFCILLALSSNLGRIDIEELLTLNATDNQNYSYTYTAASKGTYLFYSFACNDGSWGKCTNNYSTNGKILYNKKYYNYLNHGSSFVAIIELNEGQTVTLKSESYRNGYSFHNVIRLK